MNHKAIAWVLLLSIALSGCTSVPSPSPVEPSAVPAQSSQPAATPEPTITPEPTPTATPQPQARTSYDYEDHNDADEHRYKTVLGDLSKLQAGERSFALQEHVADWSFRQFEGFNDQDTWGYDVRSMDINDQDLSIVEDINQLSFNSETVWPKKLPKGFDPQQILEFNKNPGLGIRALHEKGITGEGVGIAIIDQPLLLEHEQYRDNLMFYERIHCIGETAQMHGPAVASIAVGKDIGVAPGAKLYYIAITNGHYTNGKDEFDASIIGDAIFRVLEINEVLSEQDKIRVISISRGYTKQDKGYDEITKAIRAADEQNVFVLTTGTEEFYPFSLFGMSRDYMADPDDPQSYRPAAWIEKRFYRDPNNYRNYTLMPMGSRTYAACMGEDQYEINSEGGLSWAVPWFAGFYALGCQVKPDLTPAEFIKAVKSTGMTTQFTHNEKTYNFGKMVNPAAVIEALGQ